MDADAGAKFDAIAAADADDSLDPATVAALQHAFITYCDAVARGDADALAKYADAIIAIQPPTPQSDAGTGANPGATGARTDADERAPFGRADYAHARAYFAGKRRANA